MPVLQEIAWLCSSLIPIVEMNPNFGRPYEGLRLSHFSVKEYLISDRLEEKYRLLFDIKIASACISRVCLFYLRDLLTTNKEQGGTVTDNDWEIAEEILTEFEFAGFIARNWQRYINFVEDEQNNVYTLALHLLSKHSYTIGGGKLSNVTIYLPHRHRHHNHSTVHV